MLNMHQKGGIIYKVDGRSKRQTKLHLLQICICQPLIIRLPTFAQMFIPCSKHGLLSKIITVQNLKSKWINMTEMHRVSLLHPPRKRVRFSMLEHSIEKERVLRKTEWEMTEATKRHLWSEVCPCYSSLIKSLTGILAGSAFYAPVSQ